MTKSNSEDAKWPPVVGLSTDDSGMIKGGINLYSGGVTWKEKDYNERERRAIPKATKGEATLAYISERYPNGIPAGVTHKIIVRAIKDETGLIVNERTVRRVLGGK